MTGYYDAFPIIHTTDLSRSLGFYRDLLGFKVTFEFPPDFAALKLDRGGSLALAQVPEVTPGSFQLCVYADDVDLAVERLRAAGVTVLAEPQGQVWKERMAYVSDPDGHRVMLCAPIESA